MSGNPYFISETLENGLLTAQKILFIVSSSFLMIVFYFLLRESPPFLASIRNYLLLIQITLLCKDAVMDVLFEPIPLLPVLAGYCRGVLCRANVPMLYLMNMLFWLYAMIGVSIILCSLFRHQQLLPENHWMKMGQAISRKGLGVKKFAIIFRVSFFLFFTAPCIIWVCFVPVIEKSNFDRIIHTIWNTSNIDVRWIRERTDQYILFEANGKFYPLVSLIVALVAFITAFFICLYAHMFKLLQAQKTSSRHTIRMVRRSLIALFAQLIIPFFIIVVPFTILLCSIYFGIPFAVCLVVYSLMPFHTIVHNTILMVVTPTYRKFLVDAFRCKVPFARTRIANAQFSPTTVTRRG